MTSPLSSLAKALHRLSVGPTAIGAALCGSPGETRSERQVRCRAGERLLAGERSPDLERLGNLARGLGMDIVIRATGKVEIVARESQ